MSKQYFFEAGAFPDLSYTELVCVLESFGFTKDDVNRFSNGIFLIKNERISDILIKNIFDRLGGAVRIGYIIEDIDSFLGEFQEKGEKITFGISILGENKIEDLFFLKKLGNQIKKGLRGTGISSRFVLPMRREYSLNAAQIIRNNILEKGFELDILRNTSTEIYARTIDVQDIEGFVSRDIDRPVSDIDMGVLPPKLARMMVNFTALRDGTIWDPFCGSGTIPMESVMLGFNVLASDIDDNAVKATDDNIKWLNRNGEISDILYDVFRMDVSKADHTLVKKLKNTVITGIVCEPFMGPPQKRIVSEQHAQNLLNDVRTLYESLFSLIDNRLEKRGIKVVIIIPSYKTDKGWMTFGIRDIITNRWILKNSYYSHNRDLKWTRKNSIITRNIFILERS